jgi:hypothetical protein
MVLILAGCGTDQFQRDIAVEAFVTRAEDLAHPASTDFLQDSIMPNPLANHTQLRPNLWHRMLGMSYQAVNSNCAARDRGVEQSTLRGML